MNEKDTVTARRQRLQSMRSKHKHTAAEQPTGGSADIYRRPSDNLHAGAAGPAGNQQMMAKRLLAFLTSGRPLIPGTPVNRERLMRMLQIIKNKSADRGMAMGRFQQVLDRLGSVESLDKVNPAIINKLVKLLANKAGVQLPEIAPSQGGAGADESRLQRIEQSLQELQQVIGSLASQFSNNRPQASLGSPARGGAARHDTAADDDDKWLSDIIQRM